MTDACNLVLTGNAGGRGPSAGSAADCEVLEDALAGGGEATQFVGPSLNRYVVWENRQPSYQVGSLNFKVDSFCVYHEHIRINEIGVGLHYLKQDHLPQSATQPALDITLRRELAGPFRQHNAILVIVE